MSDVTHGNGPRVVWIPQAVLEGEGERATYDLGAFTSEAEASAAALLWQERRRGPDGSVPGVILNVVTVYESAQQWLEDR